MTSLLSLHGIRKRFGNHTLFSIDELIIDCGQAYALTGPNGSGKSTLLRILGGLEVGEVEQASFLGTPIRFSPYPEALRTAIVYVHQHPVMFSTSVERNIGYGLRLRGLPRAVIAREVEEAMSWAGVAHLRNHRPDKLSGGEKQRVALARAKVLNPKLLLLDEPTANLDDAAREQVIALIPTLLDQGHSIVFASHDPNLLSLNHISRLDLQNGRLRSD